jgi:hypothetical protein
MMKAPIALMGALLLLSVVAPLYALTTPTFVILVVSPNKLVRIYAGGFSGNEGTTIPTATTLHIGNAKNYTLHAINGGIIGTDVDISMIPAGTYDCWMTDPVFGDSNHVPFTITPQ